MHIMYNAVRSAGPLFAPTLGVVIALGIQSIGPAAAEVAKQTTTPPSIMGYWLTDKRDSIVQIGACGPNNICGLIRSYKGTGKETDQGNSDKAKRSQPICNLKIIGSLVPTSTGWSSGWIYDPETGEKYQLSATVAGPNKIKLRAYVGIESLGETLVWTRSAKIPTGCLDV